MSQNDGPSQQQPGTSSSSTDRQGENFAEVLRVFLQNLKPGMAICGLADVNTVYGNQENLNTGNGASVAVGLISTRNTVHGTQTNQTGQQQGLIPGWLGSWIAERLRGGVARWLGRVPVLGRFWSGEMAGQPKLLDDR